MKNKKGFSTILGIIILLAVGGGIYFYISSQEINNIDNIPEMNDEDSVVSEEIGIEKTESGFIPKQNDKSVNEWKMFSYKDYRFSYPQTWQVSENSNLNNVAEKAIFTENGKSIAILRCPIRETSYISWKIEKEKRVVSDRNNNYDVELWDLYNDQNNFDFSLVFMNYDLNDDQKFAKSCELEIRGENYNQDVAKKIFESVYISEGDNGVSDSEVIINLTGALLF